MVEAIFPLSTWEAESGGNLYEFKASLVFIEGSRTPGILGGPHLSKEKVKRPLTNPLEWDPLEWDPLEVKVRDNQL